MNKNRRFKTQMGLSLLIAFTFTSLHLTVQAQIRVPSPVIITDEDIVDDDAPKAKKPDIPAKPTDGKPARPSSGRPVMDAVKDSVDPSMTCPMVDNRPHKKIIDAIDRLNTVLKPSAQCQNNRDVVAMLNQTTELLKVGTELQGAWDSPDKLSKIAKDATALNGFQNNVSTLVGGIDRIAQSLQNDGFLKSECGRNLMSVGGIIEVVSDLAAQAAPLAMIASAVNPAAASLFPYAAGMAGVGAVAKVIKSAVDSKTIDLSSPKAREAVLKNICEFSKISQKVRFLRYAQAGQLSQVTQEVQSMRASVYSNLQTRFSDREVFMSKTRTRSMEDFRKISASTAKDGIELNNLSRTAGQQASNPLACVLTKKIAEASESTALPNRVVNNLKFLISLQVQPTLTQTALLESEASLKDSLKKVSGNSFNECALLGRSYLEALTQVLQETKSSVSIVAASFDEQLNKDPDFAAYRRSEARAMAEVETLQKVASLLQMLNQDGAINDKMEIATQMRGMKQALFSGPNGFFGKSPALAWLDFFEDQQVRSLAEFNQEFKALQNDAWAASLSSQSNFVRRDDKGQPLKDRYGQFIRVSLAEQNDQLNADLQKSQNLSMINLKVAPLGSDNRKALCQRLENIWFSWAATMDFLSGQEFFCQSIKEFFDSNTESGLVSKCAGTVNAITGKIYQNSAIQEAFQKLQSSGANQKALLIESKMKELLCESPNASAMTTP